MGVRTILVAAAVLAGCGHGPGPTGPVVTLRDACGDDLRWDGTACVARPDTKDLAEGTQALAAMKAEEALALLDRVAARALDHPRHVALWEQRGVAEAYLERQAEALAAFDMLLALDPGHVINYQLPPKAIILYQTARDAAAARGAPRLELRWPRDQALGRPVPLELETVADPTGLLHRATIYVRTRGERTWKATDLDLAPAGKRVNLMLPGLPGRKAQSLEVYAVASDAAGNDVLSWASPARPTEIALRYDPPWYRTWWVWAIAGGVVAAGTGVVVYAVVWEPGSLLGGSISAP